MILNTQWSRSDISKATETYLGVQNHRVWTRTIDGVHRWRILRKNEEPQDHDFGSSSLNGALRWAGLPEVK